MKITRAMSEVILFGVTGKGMCPDPREKDNGIELWIYRVDVSREHVQEFLELQGWSVERMTIKRFWRDRVDVDYYRWSSRERRFILTLTS